MKGLNLRKLFLYLLITSVSVSALIGIVVLLFGNFGDFETRVLLSALTITVTSILGLMCGAKIEASKDRIVPFAGIILATASAVMWIYLIWNDPRNDFFVKSLMSVTLLAAACAHISLLTLARLDKRFTWARYAAQITVLLLTAYLLFLIWNPDEIEREMTGRIVGVLSIILAAITVVTPIFHKLSSHELNIGEIDDEILSLKRRIETLEAKKAGLTASQVD
jgi:hypothetical protein